MAEPRGERVWRLRKLHDCIDAELVTRSDAVELQFRLNARLMYERAWPTRTHALAEALQKRLELERDGWTAHW